MTSRNKSRFFVFSIVAALASFLLQPTAFAAPAADTKPAQTADGQCRHYVRDHRGHPGKGVDVVKAVYVDCSRVH